MSFIVETTTKIDSRVRNSRIRQFAAGLTCMVVATGDLIWVRALEPAIGRLR